jgi:hypothetical protein
MSKQTIKIDGVNFIIDVGAGTLIGTLEEDLNT